MKANNISKKKIIKVVETIKIKNKSFKVRIDTGAKRSSISKNLVKKLKLGPAIGKVEVKSSNGVSIRPLIRIDFLLKGVGISTEFTVADRKHMNYPILIGRNALRKGFLIDPGKK